jgi:hypothetical protein
LEAQEPIAPGQLDVALRFSVLLVDEDPRTALVLLERFKRGLGLCMHGILVPAR